MCACHRLSSSSVLARFDPETPCETRRGGGRTEEILRSSEITDTFSGIIFYRNLYNNNVFYDQFFINFFGPGRTAATELGLTGGFENIEQTRPGDRPKPDRSTTRISKFKYGQRVDRISNSTEPYKSPSTPRARYGHCKDYLARISSNRAAKLKRLFFFNGLERTDLVWNPSR